MNKRQLHRIFIQANISFPTLVIALADKARETGVYPERNNEPIFVGEEVYNTPISAHNQALLHTA